MKLFSNLPSWLKNKFFIAFTAFVTWMLVFDAKDPYTQLRHRHELKELEESKQYYTKEIAKERAELEKLRYNPSTLEKYAREKYYMKRDGEDLYIVPEPAEK
jgi:cell division protein DivIC